MNFFNLWALRVLGLQFLEAPKPNPLQGPFLGDSVLIRGVCRL